MSTSNENNNPAEIFKNLLSTLEEAKDKYKCNDKNCRTDCEKSDESSSEEEEEYDEGDEADDEFILDEETKLKMFNNLLHSHRVLCDAFANLFTN